MAKCSPRLWVSGKGTASSTKVDLAALDRVGGLGSHGNGGDEMVSYLGNVVRLLRDPQGVYRDVRDQAPVGQALLVAMGSAILLMILVERAQWSALTVQMADGIWIRPRMGRGLAGVFPWTIGTVLFDAIPSAGMLVLFVAVVLTPTLLLLVGWADKEQHVAILLRQDYAATLSVVLTAGNLAIWITLPLLGLLQFQARQMTRVEVFGVLGWLFLFGWGILAGQLVVAVQVLFQTGWGKAALISLFSFASLLALPVVMRMASFICASPFLILLLLFLLRDRVDDLLRHSRSRESFRRGLEAATLNPADASAHYQLGLLYQQRRDRAGAIRSFTRAVEIDPGEIDAQYQLGRLAREENRLPEALRYFEAVLARDPAHAQREVWREVGRVYYAAGQYGDALDMFGRFLEARPSDAEARYWCGMTYHQLGRTVEAEAEMLACLEAVRTSPSYKSRREREWRTLAESYLRGRR